MRAYTCIMCWCRRAWGVLGMARDNARHAPQCTTGSLRQRRKKNKSANFFFFLRTATLYTCMTCWRRRAWGVCSTAHFLYSTLSVQHTFCTALCLYSTVQYSTMQSSPRGIHGLH